MTAPPCPPPREMQRAIKWLQYIERIVADPNAWMDIQDTVETAEFFIAQIKKNFVKTEQLCYCGDITRLGVVHRKDTFCDAQSEKTKPEKRWQRNIVEVKRTSDQCVEVVFSSCATASEFLEDYKHAQP